MKFILVHIEGERQLSMMLPGVPTVGDQISIQGDPWPVVDVIWHDEQPPRVVIGPWEDEEEGDIDA